jgi:hypothetical protein
MRPPVGADTEYLKRMLVLSGLGWAYLIAVTLYAKKPFGPILISIANYGLIFVASFLLYMALSMSCRLNPARNRDKVKFDDPAHFSELVDAVILAVSACGVLLLRYGLLEVWRAP